MSSETGLAAVSSAVCPSMGSKAKCRCPAVTDTGSKEPSSQWENKARRDLPAHKAATGWASQLGPAWLLTAAPHKCQVLLNLDSPFENVLLRTEPRVRLRAACIELESHKGKLSQRKRLRSEQRRN